MPAARTTRVGFMTRSSMSIDVDRRLREAEIREKLRPVKVRLRRVDPPPTQIMRTGQLVATFVQIRGDGQARKTSGGPGAVFEQGGRGNLQIDRPVYRACAQTEGLAAETGQALQRRKRGSGGRTPVMSAGTEMEKTDAVRGAFQIVVAP